MQILEKELEDWVVENLDEVVGRSGCFLIGRQIRLPSGGILDVLAGQHTWGGTDIWVIEIKRDTIDAAAVIQLLTYLTALDFVRPDLNVRDYLEINGILLAPAITNEAVAAIGSSERLSFTHVKLAIEAEPWEDVKPDVLLTEQASNIAVILAESISQIVASKPVPERPPERPFPRWHWDEVEQAVDTFFSEPPRLSA